MLIDLPRFKDIYLYDFMRRKIFKTQAAMLLERLELVLRAVAAQLHIIWQLHAQNERNTLELLGKIINLINPVRFGK